MGAKRRSFADATAITRRVWRIASDDPQHANSKLIEMYDEYMQSGQTPEADLVFTLHAILKERQQTMSNGPVNIYGGNFANFNLGQQIGEINASLEVLNSRGAQSQQLAVSLDAIKTAVVESQEMSEIDKRKALDSLSLLGTEGQKPQETRQLGVLDAVLDRLPKILSAASSVGAAWHEYGPHILRFFGQTS